MGGDAIVLIWFPWSRDATGDKIILEPFQIATMLKTGTHTIRHYRISSPKRLFIFVDGKLPPGVLLPSSLEETSYQCCPEAILISY